MGKLSDCLNTHLSHSRHEDDHVRLPRLIEGSQLDRDATYFQIVRHQRLLQWFEARFDKNSTL